MDGQVEACTGGEFVCGSLAVTLLINYLDGNPIKDADGTAPYFDNLTQFMVTAENAEDFMSSSAMRTWPPTPSPTRSIRTCWFATIPTWTMTTSTTS